MYSSQTNVGVMATRGSHQQRGNESIPHDKQWTLARFFFSWLACCLTPVCIGIVQAFEYTNPFVQLSIACDIFFCLDTLLASRLVPRLVAIIRSKLKLSVLKPHGSRSVYQMKRGGPHKPPPSPFSLASATVSSRSGANKHSSLLAASQDHSAHTLVLRLLRAALPLLVPPLAQLCGASDLLQIWLTLPRLLRLQDLRLIFHTLKHKFTDLAALRNDTINRCCMTAVFTSIYASSLAAIWFYLSCRRQQECSSAEDHDSWVGRDEVLRQQDVFSIYIRSMHFIIQTLFTVGYGKCTGKSLA